MLAELQKTLVRDGRSSRSEFLLQGLLPLWFVLFALLAAPAVPALAELGLVLFIATIYMSRVALAQAIRRAHDIGLADDYLKSPARQFQAGAQAFVAVMFMVALQAAARGGLVFSLVIAAIAAAGIAVTLLGGMKMVQPLATRIGLLETTASGPAPERTVTALLGPKPQTSERPRQQHKPSSLASPAKPRRPIVRKRPRGAIGDWGAK